MAQSFLAIDFETANYQSDSACSVGLVRVDNFCIVEQTHCLIQPPYRNFVFTPIHGITWKQVENAPLFDEVWDQIQPLFKYIDFLVAHNASFDKRVLEACCKRFGIRKPSIAFQCTVKLARQKLGIYPTQLPSVCNKLKIPLKHHDALSDALACAQIAMRALRLDEPSESKLLSSEI
jgi:DNA polymerase III subunit epsilon